MLFSERATTANGARGPDKERATKRRTGVGFRRIFVPSRVEAKCGAEIFKQWEEKFVLPFVKGLDRSFLPPQRVLHTKEWFMRVALDIIGKTFRTLWAH